MLFYTAKFQAARDLFQLHHTQDCLYNQKSPHKRGSNRDLTGYLAQIGIGCSESSSVRPLFAWMWKIFTFDPNFIIRTHFLFPNRDDLF